MFSIAQPALELFSLSHSAWTKPPQRFIIHVCGISSSLVFQNHLYVDEYLGELNLQEAAFSANSVGVFLSLG